MKIGGWRTRSVLEGYAIVAQSRVHVPPQQLYSNAAEMVCVPADISHSMRSRFGLQQT